MENLGPIKIKTELENSEIVDTTETVVIKQEFEDTIDDAFADSITADDYGENELPGKEDPLDINTMVAVELGIDVDDTRQDEYSENGLSYTSQELSKNGLRFDGNKKAHPCTICSKSYQNRTSLQRHLLQHAGVHFPCHICSKKFTQKSTLKSHVELAHREEKASFPCSQCESVYNSRNHLRRHERLIHTVDRYFCEHCNETFPLRVQLKAHQKSVHPDMKYTCHECSATFRCKSTYRRHRESHAPRLFQCAICMKSFRFRAYMIGHLRRHKDKDKGNYPCQHCPKVFITRGNLNRHMQGHSGVTVECYYCAKSFVRKEALQMHMRSAHEEGGRSKYPCQSCGKSFAQLCELKRHAQIHEGIRYQCDMCEKSFTIRENLKRHQLQHEGVRHSCPVCKRSFSEKFYLKSHMDVHIGIAYECSECEKTFSKRENLKTHIKKFHKADGVRHPCTMDGCDMTFAQLKGLKVHLLEHKGKRFKCDQCLAAFTTEQSRKKHLKVQHGGVKGRIWQKT
uniref:Zinc finger protein 808 n=1 Tax=Cacopsylla melanoneura TaxID=428564 RepID=A0A8D9DXN9_9HEMI